VKAVLLLPKSLYMPPRLKNIPAASARMQSGLLTPRTPHSRAGRAEEALTELELEQIGEDEGYHEHADQHQRVPLLASSTSVDFPPSGYRARGDDYDDRDKQTTSRDPRSVIRWLVANSGLILGSTLALVLFLSIVLSYKRPDILLSAIGIDETSPSPSPTPIQDDVLPPTDLENIISYENYTRFPLDPIEYKTECHKLMGEVMGPMEFWSGHKDVVHHDDIKAGKHPAAEDWRTRICSKTITYMLDGHIGLLADLALMAQVAGLARMVSVVFGVSLCGLRSRLNAQANRTFLIDDTYWNRGKFVTGS
jgi:hypothetical protein